MPSAHARPVRRPARLWPARGGMLLGLIGALGCSGEIGSLVPATGKTGETGGTDGTGGAAGDGGSTGPDGGAGGAALGCGGQPPLDTSALAFDGDDAVSMGPAPTLGAAEFTLEAWVRRDGLGVEASTGVDGVGLVPLVTKGRGEHDGSTVDCNYALGLVGDVLGADFEDLESGANHPVIAQTPLDLGRWHHVAATYDGSLWRLYLDGMLDGETVADATPRYDSVQHFGLGAAFNSEGTPAGAFVGALDEVRVYDRALDASEIGATMYSTAPTEDGLIGHFPLDLEDGAVVDASGNDNDGTVTGATFVAPGAVLDRGSAPIVASPAATFPTDGGAILSVDVADPDGDPIYVDFYLRELTAADEFTIVAMPDSQYYTRQGDDPSYLYAQMQWAVDHRLDRNVVGLCHVGDMVDDADVGSQWQRVDDGFGILEALADPSLPDGLPFSPGVGNHDQDPNGETDGTAAFNSYFGLSRFAGRSYFGGSHGDDFDDHWVRFRSGDLEIIVLSLQYDTTPGEAVLSWARGVFETHPRALGIVTSHSILTTAGGFSTQGQAIYDALKDVPNVQILASGHVAVDARRTDEFAGNVIHSMLSDYQRAAPDPDDPTKPLVGGQGLPNGGLGFMRIWRFAPADQRLHVESYSPKEGLSYTDDRNQFELAVDLVGAGGSFGKVGTAAASEGVAAIALGAYQAGKTYEWYAVATDCVHTTPLAVQLLVGPAS